MDLLLKRAITDHHVVTFVYDKLPREVIPGVLGWHKTTGNLQLRGYQTDGESRSRSLPFWRLFRIDRISDLIVTDQRFVEPPPDYNSAGDADIEPIIAMLEF